MNASEEAVEIDYKRFPTTRYQGSKRKILNWLHGHLKDIPFNSALDAFGGTAAVSYLLKAMGKEVTYNDELKFNQIVGKALIENNEYSLDQDDLTFLTDFQDVATNNGFIEANFSEIYFTNNENTWLDKFLFKLNQFNSVGPEGDFKKSIALFSIFQACLTKRPYNLFHRKNLYMRTNDVKRNFGNKTTWERTFEEQFRKFATEANRSIFQGELACRSICSSAFDLENEGYDLVYLDPPYVDLNGDHDTIDYLYCYHFLEGMARSDEWSSLIDFESKNLRFKKELYSDRFKKRNVIESFEELFCKFQDSTIVVSYKKNGVPTIDEIVEILERFKTRVYVESMHYIYALNKQNGNAKENREVLIIGI